MKTYNDNEQTRRLLMPALPTNDDRATQVGLPAHNDLEGAVLSEHPKPLTRRTERMHAAGLTPREIVRRRQEQYRANHVRHVGTTGMENSFDRYVGQRGLGCLRTEDARDQYFNVLPLLAVPTMRRSRAYNIIDELLIDNGPYPYSPAYAFRLWLSSSPLRTQFGPSAFDIYDLARTRMTDVQREAYTDGVTIRATATALRDMGVIDAFYWATSADEIRHLLLYNGLPVVIGTDWYEGMEAAHGRVALPVGKRLGVNAYTVIGWDDRHDAALVVTSRGREWGMRGRKWLMRADLQYLLDNDGECCVPLGKHIGKEARKRRNHIKQHGKGYHFVQHGTKMVLVSDKLEGVDLYTLPATRALRTAADERKALVDQDEYDYWDHLDMGAKQ